MSSAESTPRIEKLNDKNYNSWKFFMKMVLIERGLWEIVDGVKPTVEKEVRAWEEKAKKAYASIALNIEHGQLVHIRSVDEKDPKAAWDRLQQVHQSKGTANKLLLLKSLLELKMNEGDSMQDFLNSFSDIVDQLMSIDFKLEDDFLCLLLLTRLPDSYQPLAMALESKLEDNELTLSTIHARLLAEEARRKNQQSSPAADSALNLSDSMRRDKSRALSSAPKSTQSPTSVRRCNYCKRRGHLEAECYKKAYDERDGAKDKANQVEDEDEKANFGFSLKASEDIGTIETTHSIISSSDQLFLDSGSSQHLVAHRHWLHDYEPITPIRIFLADNRHIEAVGRGTIKARCRTTRSKPHLISIKDAYYVPKITNNLVSVRKLTENGHRAVFDATGCTVLSSTDFVVARAPLLNKQYVLSATIIIPKESANATKTGGLDVNIWHRRLGHLGEKNIRKLATSGMVKGMDIDKSGEMPFCESCVQGKLHRNPFPKAGATRAKGLLDLIHSDVCGPISPPSVGGARYFITFTDDKSRKTSVYFLKKKSDAFEKFKEFKAKAENELGRHIKRFRTDGGGEYTSGEFDKHLKELGIAKETTISYSPQQNGVAERLNRTILDRARTMLIASGLGKEFWAEAVATSVYVTNMSPHASVDSKTPHEAWHNTKPDISHLRPFGCLAYCHIPDQRRSKLDAKAIKCIFLGYTQGAKGYRFWNPATRKVVVSRDVVFVESETYAQIQTDSGSNQELGEEVIWIDTINQPSDSSPHQTNAEDDKDNNLDGDESDLPLAPIPARGGSQPPPETIDKPTSEEMIIVDTSPSIAESQQASAANRRYPQRERHAPARWVPNARSLNTSLACVEKGQICPTWENEMSPPYSDYATLMTNIDEPQTLREALTRADSSQWEQAAQLEYESIIKNDTWTLVDLPPGRRAIGCKWVFKVKYDALGNIERYKARLVAKGYSQTEGIDFNETFAPVAKFNSIRVLLALAAQQDFEVHQMDVKTAFLNGDLEEEIYMQQPEGFISIGQEGKVCKLKRSLYGLKQAGRSWYHKIDTCFSELGLQRTHADNCVYQLRKDGTIIIVAIYVDDLLILANDVTALNNLKLELGKRFDMKDLGEVHFCLGIQVTRNRQERTIRISQAKYIEDVLKRFNMQDSKPIGTPLDASVKLTKDMSPASAQEEEEMKNVPYQSAIGSIMYAMLGTRPDISYAVGVVSQFSSAPGRSHWNAVKRILRYLKGTVNYALEYKGTDSTLIGYSDADWGGNLDDRRSTTGYVFSIAGGAVSWSSKKQPTVALSTTEAEYMALTQATKEGIWIRRLLEEIGIGSDLLSGPTIIRTDNQGSIALAKNPIYHARTKHIDIRYHFIREKVEDGEVELSFCRTDDMTADVLTKGLSKEKHWRFSEGMGLVCQ